MCVKVNIWRWPPPDSASRRDCSPELETRISYFPTCHVCLDAYGKFILNIFDCPPRTHPLVIFSTLADDSSILQSLKSGPLEHPRGLFFFSYLIIQFTVKCGQYPFQNSPRTWPLFAPSLLPCSSKPPEPLAWILVTVFALVSLLLPLSPPPSRLVSIQTLERKSYPVTPWPPSPHWLAISPRVKARVLTPAS